MQEDDMQRKGSAVWQGGLKDGKGTVSTESGVLRDTTYNFAQRFENAPGTNPEELIAAAHAACFSMALSAVLGESNLRADRIETTATATLEKTDAGFTVTKIQLDVTADIPNADNAAFQEAAEKAKKNCPISRLLAAANITMEARLRAGSRA
jgi:lipoyl-dependent peroxiredoxin